MRHYALIGRTLTHSYSKQLFDAQHFADADYRLCAMPSVDGLRRWVEREGIDGFNVTNPYKQAVIPHLDALDAEARAIGAVNCVCVDGGRLIGHNTDAPAFRDTLERGKWETALILGTGGAARAVAHALGQMGIPYRFVSRTPERHPDAIGYSQLSTFRFPPSTLIVNATPVGTFPDVDRSPLNFSELQPPTSGFFVYDLVYNPSPTLLLRQAAAAGAATHDGLAMLHRQAALSWALWNLPSEH